MDARTVERTEWAADVGAVAILAVAVAYAVIHAGASTVLAAAMGAAAFFIGFRVLRSIAANDGGFALAQFTPAVIAQPEPELLLTDEDRLEPAATVESELVLDDVLAKLGEDSRVVSLFDASAMPTPAQLRARIDRHLSHAQAPHAAPDASAALHEALAELRRSLK